MSNLVRGQVDLLLNTLSKDDIGVYFDGTVKHVVLKKLGYDLVGPATTVVIKRAKAGQKMKRILTPIWKWNGEATQLFEIEVTRQPLYDGRPEHEFQRAVTYSFKMDAFTTDTPGTLNNTDKDTILDGLIAAITADVQVTPEAIMTGAVVVATKTAQTLVLEAKDYGTIFTVQTYAGMFSQPTLPTVGFMKPKLTNESVAQIFAVKVEDAGRRLVYPIIGVDYACITLVTKTAFPGMTLPSSFDQVAQKINIYTPVSQLSVNVVDLPADASANADGMAGTTVDSTIKQALTAVCASLTDLDA